MTRRRVPPEPKIYHIVHVDRLPSIIAARRLWCDAEVSQRDLSGTCIGVNEIKQRRLANRLHSHEDLYVGDCVPFYFCPRSIMLFVIHKRNHPNLTYRDGQKPIVHLEADLRGTVAWADDNARRWVFTLSNAGSYCFEERCSLDDLSDIDWTAVRAQVWSHCKDAKQAEFLVERSFPWELVSRIGVCAPSIQRRALSALQNADHRPSVEIKRNWYYST